MDYYEILGIARDATPDAVKTAYNAAARLWHPDNGGDKTRMQQVNEAYETLRDPAARAEYDRTGAGRGKAAEWREAAEAAIVQAFISVYNAFEEEVPDDFDMIREVRRQLVASHSAAAASIQNVQREMGKLANIRRRLKRRPAADFLGAHLDKKAKALEASMAAMREKMSIVSIAVGRLADYGFEVVTPQPQWPTPDHAVDGLRMALQNWMNR